MKRQAKSSGSRVRIAVDIGGTFTDGLAALMPGGRIWVAKTLTTPRDPGEAVTTVIADLLRQIASPGSDSVPASRKRATFDPHVAEVVHGTTLVTNTLIERKGAATGLIVTKGTRDVLDIGREWRYDLYDLNLKLPEPLAPLEQRRELDERLDASGAIVKPLSAAELDALLEDIDALDVEAVAVCFLHAYVNDKHEKTVAAAITKRFPKLAVSVSSAIAREIREYERMSTTVANAYVQPLVAQYLRSLD